MFESIQGHLLEVVADVEHREAIDLEARLRLRLACVVVGAGLPAPGWASCACALEMPASRRNAVKKKTKPALRFVCVGRMCMYPVYESNECSYWSWLFPGADSALPSSKNPLVVALAKPRLASGVSRPQTGARGRRPRSTGTGPDGATVSVPNRNRSGYLLSIMATRSMDSGVATAYLATSSHEMSKSTWLRAGSLSIPSTISRSVAGRAAASADTCTGCTTRPRPTWAQMIVVFGWRWKAP